MTLQRLLDDPAIETARSLIRERDAETVDEQVRIAAIPAPTGEEGERGAYLQARFDAIGLEAVERDEAGNVLGLLPGAEGRPPVIIASHLDTVFPAGTPIHVVRDGDRIAAPGISDNARGLAALLAIAGALREAEVRPDSPLLFVASVGEEGLGDLRGVKHLFREGSPWRTARAFISLDGPGITRVVHRSIGARRLKATITGAGGHSWGDRGLPNPVHALGMAIERLRRLVPDPRVERSLNVGRVGGGTSVNAIPCEAWLELDLRGSDQEGLAQLEKRARLALRKAVDDEAAGAARRAPLALGIDVIGDRPSGVTPLDCPLVQAVIEASRTVGAEPEMVASSTDANVPMALGIPSVAIGAGGGGGGVHTTAEWFTNDGGVLGVERALLALLAAAGLRGP